MSSVVPSLKKNVVWSFIGIAAFSLGKMATMVFLAKLGGAADLGEFSLGIAICAPVMMFSNLNLRSAQATDMADEYKFKHYLTLRCITTIISIIIIFTTALLFFGPGSVLITMLVAVAKAAENCSDAYYGFFQKKERLISVTYSLVGRGICSAAAVAVLMALFHNLYIAVLGYAASWGAVLVFQDIPNGRRQGVTFSLNTSFFKKEWKTLLSLFKLTLPLGIVMGIISLNANIPRYFVMHTHGDKGYEMLGYFSGIVYFSALSGIVMQAIGYAVSPRLAKYNNERRRKDFVRLMYKIGMIALMLGISGIAFAALFGKFVLTLFYGPEFAHYNDVFIYVMIFACLNFLCSIYGFSLTALRQFRVEVLVTGVATIAVVLGCILLVNPYAMKGAVWAMCAGSVAQLTASAIVTSRRLNFITPRDVETADRDKGISIK